MGSTFFISRAEAEKLSATMSPGHPLYEKAVLVSCSTPTPTEADLKLLEKVMSREEQLALCKPANVDSPGWLEVVRLEFNDVDLTNTSEGWLTGNNYIAFGEEHADRVIDLIERHKETQGITFVCHCDAGISRSAAISKFIARQINAYFPESYSIYNKHVFSTLSRRLWTKQGNGWY